MSFDSEAPESKPKKLKQLSIFEVLGKKSKKRKQPPGEAAMPRKRTSFLSKITSPSKEHDSKDKKSPKSMSCVAFNKGNAAANDQAKEAIVVSDDSQEIVDGSKADECIVTETGAEKLNESNICHMGNVHLTGGNTVSHKCGEGFTMTDDMPSTKAESDPEHKNNANSSACKKNQPQDSNCHIAGTEKKVLDDNHIRLKKEFAPILSKTDPLRGWKRNPASDSPKHSQDSDDLYETIMRDKRDANRKCLNTDIKLDSDISQGTPPRPVSPKPVTKDSEPNAMNIYDSPDMFDTFPSQDFDADFEEEKSTPKWLGKPKSRLKVAPDCLPPLPELKQSENHTVLFDASYFDLGQPPPSFSAYRDAWNAEHVKLPCSPKSLFPTPQGINKSLTNRWELIETALLNDINGSAQLEESILHYNRFPPSFLALHSFFGEVMQPAEKEEFFSQTLPKMVNLALSLPNLITQPIPLLKKQRAHCITLSQQQIACLLANAFFCTFPRRNSSGPNSEYATYPSINFNRLFVGVKSKPKRGKSHMEKLKTILHYFKRITDEMPSGVVTFERRVAASFPIWNRSPCEMCELHISKVGLIEDDGKGMLQMDFANKYVGGGVLGGGLVQEEILFCIYPELIVSRLFTEVLDDNECMIITGAERYSSYSGYADTYNWEGDYVDTNSRDSWRRKLMSIVALDATPFWKTANQYRPGNIRRELNKLYCGFWCSVDADFSPAIATGNWGCGAFGGDPILKALLQLMAAAVVGRDLCYFTFNDEDLMNTIHEMYTFVRSSDLRVCDLWNQISKYNEEEVAMAEKQKRPLVENIFEFMQRMHKDYQTSTDEGDSTPEKMSEEW